MCGRRSAGLAALPLAFGLVLVAAAQSRQRPAEAPADPVQQRIANLERSLSFAEQSLARRVEELTLFQRLQDLAVVDKVRYTGPPPRVIKNPTGPGAKNPVIVPAYT